MGSSGLSERRLRVFLAPLYKAIGDSLRLGLPSVVLSAIFIAAPPALSTALADAGSRAKVAGIQFEGNAAFSDQELLRWMRLQPPRLLRRERFAADLLEEDLESLRRFYKSEGFIQAEIEGGIDAAESRERGVFLVIRVREGKAWIVSELHVISIDAAGPALLDSLFAVIRLRPPAPYRVRELAGDRGRLYEALAGMGYLDASVGVEVKLHPRDRTAAVRYRIERGARARLRDLEIRGLQKTRPFVVEREISIRPGQLLTPRVAGEVRASLLRTGLFRTARVIPNPADWGRARKTLLVALEENPPGSAGFGLGYGSIDRTRLLVSLDQRNLRGRGVRVALRGVVGERRRSVESELSTPWTLGHRLLTQLSSAYEYSKPRSFEAERIRGGIAFKLPLGFFWSASLGYKAERVVLLETPAIGYGPEAIRLGTLACVVARDTRDDLNLPSAGGYLRMTQAWTGPWLGSQNNYSTTEVRRLRFRSVGPVVFASRAEAGWLQPQRSGRHVPLSERYFAGGFSTLRGFPEEAVGPVDEAGHSLGGNARLLGSLELGIPLYKRITCAVYADAGQVAYRLDEFAISRVSVGVGTGIRLRSPVGRLRADIAFPVTTRFADGPQLYIGTGGAF